jgi:hypothetical protein
MRLMQRHRRAAFLVSRQRAVTLTLLQERVRINVTFESPASDPKKQ